MSIIKNNLKYSKTHEWVLVNGDIATIGLTDFAQSELGDLVYCETETIGTDLEVDSIIGSVESVKSASDLYSPVSGEIIEVWENAGDEPELINEDPYGRWIVKIRLSNPSEVDDLLSDLDYEAFCEESKA